MKKMLFVTLLSVASLFMLSNAALANSSTYGECQE